MDSDEDQQALAWQQIIRNKAFYNVRVQRGESWVDAACRTLDELIDQKEQAEKSLSEFLESQITSRDDLPTCGETIDALNHNRDALVENRDKSISSLQRLLANTEYHEARWRRAHEIVERERDQAREERSEAMHLASQAAAERDEALEASTLFQRDVHEWRARAEAAEARTAPAVSYPLHQPDGTRLDASHLPIDSNDDPALYVIREPDLPTVRQDDDGEWYPGDRWDLADDRFIDVEGALEKMRRYAAIARAIEAEQVVDPIEAKAQELWEVGKGMSVNIEFDDIAPDHRGEYLRIARHLLGQEGK